MDVTVENYPTLPDGTRLRVTKEGDEIVLYEVGRGYLDFSVRDMGGWWRASGGFSPSRADPALKDVRYDCKDVDEALAFVLFGITHESDMDFWKDWAVSFDRTLASGRLLQVRKQIGDETMQLAYSSRRGPGPLTIDLRVADLEKCAMMGRLQLSHSQALELLEDGDEIGSVIEDLSAVHSRTDRSSLVLGLAQGPLGLEHEQLSPVEEADMREKAMEEAQRLIRAEHRSRDSMMHMALMSMVDGATILARIGRDQDGDAFMGSVTTTTVRDMNEDIDSLEPVRPVPDRMVAHDGPIEVSAALAVAIELEFDDSDEAVLTSARSAWEDVRLIAERLLGIEVEAELPNRVLEELEAARGRLRDQVPEGVWLGEKPAPVLTT